MKQHEIQRLKDIIDGHLKSIIESEFRISALLKEIESVERGGSNAIS